MKTDKKIKSKEKNLMVKKAPFFNDNNKSFKIVAWVLIFILSTVIYPMVIWFWCAWLVYKLFSGKSRLPVLPSIKEKNKTIVPPVSKQVENQPDLNNDIEINKKDFKILLSSLSLNADEAIRFLKKVDDIQPNQTYSGYNATLKITDNGVIITKKSGLGSAFLGGEKTIPYSSITAIEYKKPDMYPGWIRFSLIGVQQKSGVFSVAYDENAILFHFDPNGIFKEAKEIIEDKMNKFHSRN